MSRQEVALDEYTEIRVRVWGYLGATAAMIFGDKSSYRRFLGVVGDRRRVEASWGGEVRRQGHRLGRGWSGRWVGLKGWS
jgi:hypothetical protein